MNKSRVKEDTPTLKRKYTGLIPILTNIFINKYRIDIHRKSKTIFVTFSNLYILFKELFTFKKRIRNKTIDTPNTKCPKTTFLLKNKNANNEI